MRRVIDGLIVLVGMAVLALLVWVRPSAQCEPHPFFTMQGTAADCAVRYPKPELPIDAGVMAKVE